MKRSAVAPQMVMHSCGHSGRYHLHGLVSEQMKKFTVLESAKCRKCSKRNA